MTLSRANVEKILISRLGNKLTAAGLDGTTITGSNASLNDPIGYALRLSGYGVFDITNVADSDLLPVSNTTVDQVLDLAELRTLESVAGNLAVVDQIVGPRRMMLTQLSDQVEKEIARMREKVTALYGIGIGSLDAGTINLDFQEKPTDQWDNAQGSSYMQPYWNPFDA